MEYLSNTSILVFFVHIQGYYVIMGQCVNTTHILLSCLMAHMLEAWLLDMRVICTIAMHMLDTPF